MITKMYSLYDKRGQFFERPVLSMNDMTAKRLIFNALHDPQSKNQEFVRTPSDFQLYCLGSYDDGNGNIDSSVAFICEVTDLNASIEGDTNATK